MTTAEKIGAVMTGSRDGKVHGVELPMGLSELSLFITLCGKAIDRSFCKVGKGTRWVTCRQCQRSIVFKNAKGAGQ